MKINSFFFFQQVNEVPSGIFLEWITQIIARFNFKNICFLDNLLVRLATTYPSTVTYTFQLAYNQYQRLKRNAPIRSAVQQILDATKNSMIEKFIENVSYLSLPDKVLIYHLVNVYNKININPKEELRTCYENVYGNERGKSAEKVAMFKQELIKLMEMDGECV